MTAATMFHDMWKPLRLWFQVRWGIVGQIPCASAVNLLHLLEVGSDTTAWTQLHTVRRAMVRPGRPSLTGEVAVDETFVGGGHESGGRLHSGRTALVAIAAEVRGAGIRRSRTQRVRDVSASTLSRFVREAVSQGRGMVRAGR